MGALNLSKQFLQLLNVIIRGVHLVELGVLDIRLGSAANSFIRAIL